MARRRRNPEEIAPRPSQHAQTRISDEAAVILAEIAANQGISQSELVRDILYSFLFTLKPGQTLKGPDQGYRLAKASASVIARRMLYEAYQSLPTTWRDFQSMMAAEPVDE